jgi:hypothetical protein
VGPVIDQQPKPPSPDEAAPPAPDESPAETPQTDDGSGLDDVEGQPQPETAPAEPEPQPSDKLVFVCRQCGTLNDLMKEDAMVAVPQRSERYDTCPECAGLGLVDTGSLVVEKGTVQCPGCSGAGYVETRSDAEGNPQPPVPPSSPEGTPPFAGAIWNAEANSYQPWPNAQWNQETHSWQ